MPSKANIAKPAARPVRLQGMKRLVDAVQEQFAAWVLAGSPVPDRETEQFAHQISLQIEKIEGRLRLKSLDAKNLSPKTATALRWLSFLKDPQKVRLHLHSLAEACAYAEELAKKKKAGLFKWAAPQVSLQFYSTRYLYHGVCNPQKITILLNEAFIGAPAALIQDLVYLAMHRHEKKRLKAVRLYTRQPVFVQNYALLAVRQTRIKAPQGKHVDLREVFQRVNRQYFENRLSEPRLGWSTRKSRRKYGHYQEESDTVVINPSLDSPQIPAFAVDFVMYHELLHKHLGTVCVNGRRRAHTPAFRAAEKKFELYDKAQAALKQITQSM